MRIVLTKGCDGRSATPSLGSGWRVISAGLFSCYGSGWEAYMSEPGFYRFGCGDYGATGCIRSIIQLLLVGASRILVSVLRKNGCSSVVDVGSIQIYDQ